MKRVRGRLLRKTVTIRGRRFLFRVEDSETPADYLKYEALRNSVWQYPADNLPSGRNMMCENFLHDGSSLFIGVFAEDKKGALTNAGGEIVGFSYGFVGLKDKSIGFRSPDNLQFYSQYNAVREDFRGFNLGIKLKEFQRDQVRDVFGLATITCTFDPLTAVNAHRNVHHFGMDVLDYRADIYGDFGGRLNRLDVPRDRFSVSWDLNKKGRRNKYRLAELLQPERRVIVTKRVVVAGNAGPTELEVIQEIRPALDQKVLLVEIPADFYRMLQMTDVGDRDVRGIPVDWRMKTRKIFQNLLGKSYRVSDFLRTNTPPQRYFYILESREKSAD
jgi:predicted GNAT superfamily acetyltransferase